MKRVLMSILGIWLATLACGAILPATAPTQPSVETIVAQTVQALTTAAPTEPQVPSGAPMATSEVQLSGIPISFENVSFVIPNGLASGASAEIVPAVAEGSGDPWDVAPEYKSFVLQGYMLSGQFFEPHILIYPAPEYERMSQGAATSLARLRAILAAPQSSFSPDALPGLPSANAVQLFAARIKVINFRSGSGVRFLTEYAQYVATVNNYDMFYHFQGLTSDGKYYLIAILPANASFLAADPDYASPIPSDGIPFPQNLEDTASVYAYYDAVTEKLNTAPAEAFTPALELLDTLIASIEIASQ